MYVTVNGARLFFDVSGEGLVPDGARMRAKPTVILVHGGPGADHSVHKPYFAKLADLAQVVYYDHRGNGRSDLCDASTWTLAQWGDDLKGLCDALGVARPIVIGTSFGGFVAQSYATRHPGHAAGLGLISTAARIDFAQVYAAFERLGGAPARAVAEAYWNNPTDDSRAAYRDQCVPLYSVRPAQSTDWISRIVMRNETALHFNGPKNEQGRMDFRASLAKVACPVLIMAGDSDPITPMVFSDEIAAHLPPGKITVHRFENCGHGVVTDRPDAALAALRAFIQSVDT